jgi:hypothetical protein
VQVKGLRFQTFPLWSESGRSRGLHEVPSLLLHCVMYHKTANVATRSGELATIVSREDERMAQCK